MAEYRVTVKVERIDKDVCNDDSTFYSQDEYPLVSDYNSDYLAKEILKDGLKKYSKTKF